MLLKSIRNRIEYLSKINKNIFFKTIMKDKPY